MDIKTTRVFEDITRAWLGGKRRCLLEGGTYGSKTWSTLQFLILTAMGIKEELLTSVVSESLPHLKRGVMRDFFHILGESPDNNPYFNKTENIYRRPDWRGWFDFFGADDASKVRGPRRHILFINEGNNIPWEAARGLDVRTEKFTIVDWNPVSEFWAHEFWLNRPENAYSHSTYKDALAVLSKEVVDNIESNRELDTNWWRVFGEGLLGKLEHLIWPNYEVVVELPSMDRWQKWAYGLDFGFTHPMALVKVIFSAERLYWDERVYQSKLTNADLVEKLSHEDRADIYADHSRPEAIEEVMRAGYNIYPANKAVKMGLDVVKRQKVYITQQSVGLLKEIRNYSYKKDKDGHILEEPVKIADDCCDAGRYGTLGLTERFGYATAAPGGNMVGTRQSIF